MNNLVFKGGTCLAKVYTDFYRLSEDLDFSLPISRQASRTERSKRMKPVKKQFHLIDDNLPGVEIESELRGHNESKQYIGVVKYDSIYYEKNQKIKLEISLREKLLQGDKIREAESLLVNPLTEEKLVNAIEVKSLSYFEVMAEKFRSALTRQKPAIRDYFDINHAIKNGQLNPASKKFQKMVEKKISIHGDEQVVATKDILRTLKRQLNAELKPVLRDKDFKQFNLQRAFELVTDQAQNFTGKKLN